MAIPFHRLNRAQGARDARKRERDAGKPRKPKGFAVGSCGHLVPHERFRGDRVRPADRVCDSCADAREAGLDSFSIY